MSAAAEMVIADADEAQVEVVTDLARFEALRRDWGALVEASAIEHPFLTHEWLRTWWRAFGGDHRLQLVTVRLGGRLVAAAPLMRSEEHWFGLRVSVLESIANDHSPRCDLLVARDAGPRGHAALWRALRALDWDVLRLRQLVDASPTLQRVGGAALDDGLALGRWRAERSPYVRFDGSWKTFFAGLSYNHRRNLRKSRRRLERKGRLALEVVSDPAEVDAAVSEGMRIEAAAWKARAGTAMESRPEVRAFYESFARDAASRGSLRLFFLTLDGHRIAFSYGLLYAGSIFVLKGGYDPAWRRYSPYHVLYWLVFRMGFSDGLKGYEFLGADEPFKMKWTDRLRQQWWLYVFARTPRAKLLHFLKFRLLPGLRAWRPTAAARDLAVTLVRRTS